MTPDPIDQSFVARATDGDPTHGSTTHLEFVGELNVDEEVRVTMTLGVARQLLEWLRPLKTYAADNDSFASEVGNYNLHTPKDKAYLITKMSEKLANGVAQALALP